MKFLILAVFSAVLIPGCDNPLVSQKTASGKISNVRHVSNVTLGQHITFSLTTTDRGILRLAIPGDHAEIKDGVNLEVTYKNKTVSRMHTFDEKRNPDGSVSVTQKEIEFWLVVQYKILNE